ncbi:hypothetical protein AVEN_265325-1 [Araneus ventricosus]|uniref:Uncharacterized protein n=1 Tax=Araneus ventricosus TaxID=182803 RepID=A0A4Y2SBW5_ARAVE|nr:hypothetical protein AVEN_265713-1 [Araneus ventricosus]GBN85077.1 hypothetical protein AVEN_268818-1 [Araneus ventricosus]GBN85888.1 hypothetical protein AVEN_220979-1 [Araneus ventricosus]GBN85924.1 hypothetical protein AVEN_265325-1 [Araneus ventricosus]
MGTIDYLLPPGLLRRPFRWLRDSLSGGHILFRTGRKWESIKSRWGDIADPEDRFYFRVVERRFAVWVVFEKNAFANKWSICLFAKNGMHFSNVCMRLHLSIGSRE